MLGLRIGYPKADTGPGAASMSTWAAIALSEPPKAAPPPVEAVGKGEVVSVIDANAIISGLSIQHALDRLVTTPEVLEEVRDKRSRQRLEALPFKLEALEPSEESVRAGVPPLLCPFLAQACCARMHPPVRRSIVW